MKKIKLGIIFAALSMLLCACSDDSTDLKSPIIVDENTISAPEINSSEDSSETPSDNIITEDDTNPPRPGMVRSRLTNEWVDEEIADTRPIAVITPNEKDAFPQYGLSNASVLYEANVEGRMTRMMAIYEGWDSLEKIGNIRSLRSYYAYWAFEWDAFIVHYGGPSLFISDLLAQPTTQHLDGDAGGADAVAFYRDNSRKMPHNGYATGSGLLDAITQKDFSLSYRGLSDEKHYQFTNMAKPNTLEQYGSAAKNATYIDMSGCYPLTRCYFEYNDTDGLYYRSQHLSGSSDGPHLDSATGEQLKFKNIIIQNTKHEEIGGGYLSFQCHDDTRDGWYFTGGKGIHITWEKYTDYGATRYYDEDGNEIVLNTGKTMVCIVEDGDSFTYR